MPLSIENFSKASPDSTRALDRIRVLMLAIVRRSGAASWSLGRKATLGALGLALVLLVMAARPLPDDWYPRMERAGGVPVAATAPDAESAGKTPELDPATQNLRAFAKLYGYVRYFHPSDAAAKTDWDAFAVHGVRRVRNAESQAELRATLDSLFGPIAPTIQFYETGGQSPVPHDVLTPADTTGLNLVAWQHKGLGLGNRGPYESARLHRGTESKSNVGTVGQSIDATPHRGKQVRLRAAVRTDVSGAGNRAQLWLRVDRGGGETGFFDNMDDRPITTPDWSTYQITGTVAEDATRILLGGLLHGSGTAHFDAFQLQVRDSSGAAWQTVPLENAGFEAGSEPLTGWRSPQDSYTFQSKQGAAAEDQQFLSITPTHTPTKTEPGPAGLFQARPTAGETVTRPLGRGLSAQIPLALYSRNGQTLRPDAAPSPDALRGAIDEIALDRLTAEDNALRRADVIITWNVLQHFYPYFEIVDADWDQVLTQSLQRAAADSSSRDLSRTLERMLAALKDGHGRVSHPSDSLRAGLPLRFDWVEESVVVADTATYGEGTYEEDPGCVRPGDVLTGLDGTPVEEALRARKRYVSGAPQWRMVRALWTLGWGRAGTTARLTLRRQGETVECQLPRANDAAREQWRKQLETEPRPDSIDVLSGGAHYVDLTRVGIEALRPRLDTLARAEAVVFDVRGYPEGGAQELLQHLSPDMLRSAHFEVPKILYPDRENLAGYTGGRWTLPPKEPQFTGEIMFLTDGRAISYAESVMGIVEHYDLGTIVGRPTAGTNGNVNPLELPGQHTVHWTGMRVQKHDRSRHHLVGIRPDVEAKRTIGGVKAGRDEVLRKALHVLDSTR